MIDAVTIITGGAQGIGRTIAQFLAEKGSHIAIFDVIEASEIVTEIRAMGKKCEFYHVDVADAAMVKGAIDQTAKDFGKIDNLVNNAGITRDNLLLRMKEEDWDKVLDINLKGVFQCTKGVVRYMLKTGGAIVNISSVVGIMGNAGQANYAASKAGIIGFTKSVAKEYAERNIRVNAVAPGFIRTKMTDALDEKTREEMFNAIPLKRLGEAKDVAYVVYFLLSAYGNYITGEVISVNGGLHM
ncbi:MAG TPA: 3-oxoacyl-[acyl-carrier-protein] reductase [Syntrophorhabdaceae bacterium]|nr:3-oxoacyl-[acyl-carrier-protein] reductase [Syntrophorhabdaceae bacterium]